MDKKQFNFWLDIDLYEWLKKMSDDNWSIARLINKFLRDKKNKK